MKKSSQLLLWSSLILGSLATNHLAYADQYDTTSTTENVPSLTESSQEIKTDTHTDTASQEQVQTELSSDSDESTTSTETLPTKETSPVTDSPTTPKNELTGQSDTESSQTETSAEVLVPTSQTQAQSTTDKDQTNATSGTDDSPLGKVVVAVQHDTAYVTYKRPADQEKADIQHAVWSDVQGQDDLKWYKAGQTLTEIDLSKHKGYGTFHIHTYEFINGKAHGLNAAEVTIDRPKPVVTPTVSGDTLNIEYIREKDVKHSKVLHAVWSDTKGQDDLKWYDAGLEQTQVKLTNHKGYGSYHVNTYALVDGQMVGLKATSFSIDKPALTIDTNSSEKGILDVTIKNVPTTSYDIMVPIWSDKQGQDDMKWYTAQKIENGDYTVRVFLKNHNFDSGKYNIHVYGKSYVQPEQVGLLATSVLVSEQELPSKAETEPRIQISDIDTKNGRYSVKISETAFSKDIQSIALATWSDNQQSNLKWYQANDKDQTDFTVAVDMRNHQGLSGIYKNHVYITYTDGSKKGYVADTVDFSSVHLSTYVQETYLGTGVYQFDIKNVSKNGKVLFAVWSNDGGQDDIHWYSTTPSGPLTFTGIINTQHHKGTGVYNLHAYQELNGQLQGVLATTFNVDRSDFSAPYYSQRDGRWANQVFGVGNIGQTGCVPTTLSSVFSALKGEDIRPTDVASYLYHQTDTFNKGMAGTNSKGIVLAAKNWGLRSQVMTSEADLRATLEQGHYVMGAVGQSQFVRTYGTTHELVLKGYNSGQTYVMDPYTPENNGWYAVSYLFSHRSFDPGDNTEGLPFIAIKD